MSTELERFPFKYFDPIRQRWIQARYKATGKQIAARYEKWEVTGPGERQLGGSGQFEPPTASEKSGEP